MSEGNIKVKYEADLSIIVYEHSENAILKSSSPASSSEANESTENPGFELPAGINQDDKPTAKTVEDTAVKPVETTPGEVPVESFSKGPDDADNDTTDNALFPSSPDVQAQKIENIADRNLAPDNTQAEDELSTAEIKKYSEAEAPAYSALGL